MSEQNTHTVEQKVLKSEEHVFKPGIEAALLSGEEDRDFYVPIVQMARKLLDEGYSFRLYDDDMTVAVEYPDGKVRHFMKMEKFPQSDSNFAMNVPIQVAIEKAIRGDLKR